jgi:hypothetical protein
MRGFGAPRQTTVVMASSTQVLAQRSWNWRKGGRVLQIEVLRLPDRAIAGLEPARCNTGGLGLYGRVIGAGSPDRAR